MEQNFFWLKKNYKYFIGYLYDNHKIRPLHIILPKRTAYVKFYDRKTQQQIYFLIDDDDDLLEKYNTIWDKVSKYQKRI